MKIGIVYVIYQNDCIVDSYLDKETAYKKKEELKEAYVREVPLYQ